MNHKNEDSGLKHFQFQCAPSAPQAIVVQDGSARFTILTSRLIRCECSEAKVFEDRPTQNIWFRDPSTPPAYRTRREGEILLIETDHLLLKWRSGASVFSENNLSITLRESGVEWKHGMADPENLKGTVRTLDNANGHWYVPGNRPLDLSDGLISRSGWAVLDDSESLVFDDAGFLQSRASEGHHEDLYFFGYGHDYSACLREYFRIAGRVPLLPRWALGVWWSRWWRYSQADLEELVDTFRAHGVPLSVCVVDMDWHVTRNPYTSGWTGYSWNNELFPEPRKFFENIHGKGVRACMNLHPADGVHPHEAAYDAMAQHMGLDPDEKKPIAFDISDPHFIDGYFRLLHHPLEEDGVDFWWIDWQQGSKSQLKGLDPLFYLNHLHTLDRARDGRKRPFIFSRWSGRGAHRTPIGFSGDTYATWQTLRFLPWFTATAANVGFGWWSHDTGGFARGIQDPEMYVRWNQFSCWSPIYRIHSTCDAKADNRPWVKEAEYGEAAMQAMRQRRKLEPYIYTAGRRHHLDGEPLLRPMYYSHGDTEAAYQCPGQYAFGPDLIVAPFLEPRKATTRLSRSVVWLPEGEWREFNTGLSVPGGRWKANYGDLNSVPVFAKAGAVLPMAESFADNGELLATEWLAFAGADGAGEFYHDDGVSMDYASGHFSVTECRQVWSSNAVRFLWERKEGDFPGLPIGSLRLRGLQEVSVQTAKFNGHSIGADWMDNGLVIGGLNECEGELVVHFSDSPHARTETSREILERLLWHMPINTHSAQRMFEKSESLANDPSLLAMFMADLDFDQMRTLIESMTGACFHHFALYDGRDAFCYSCPRAGVLDGKVVMRKDMVYDLHDVGQALSGEWVFDARNAWYHWKAQVRYLGFLNLTLEKPQSEAMREDCL